MAVDDWYLAPQLNSARTELLAAHHRLREALPLGHSHPDFVTVLQRAKQADEAYFALFPGHVRDNLGSESVGSEEDQQWVATDAAASRIEGFTAGDPD